jgi:hypothetical protein
MLVKNMSVKSIVSAFGETYIKSLVSFRDAGIGPADYPIGVADVLRGLHIGISNDWVQTDRF